jgi:acyl carrier protein
MEREEIQARIISMIAETFELDAGEITADSKLYEDLDLDSIDALDMVVKLQEFMNRRVNEGELRQLRTVGDVVNLVVEASVAGVDGRGPEAKERAG